MYLTGLRSNVVEFDVCWGCLRGRDRERLSGATPFIGMLARGGPIDVAQSTVTHLLDKRSA